MKFEKAVVTRIEVEEEDIITTSVGCTDKGSRQSELYDVCEWSNVFKKDDCTGSITKSL